MSNTTRRQHKTKQNLKKKMCMASHWHVQTACPGLPLGHLTRWDNLREQCKPNLKRPESPTHLFKKTRKTLGKPDKSKKSKEIYRLRKWRQTRFFKIALDFLDFLDFTGSPMRAHTFQRAKDLYISLDCLDFFWFSQCLLGFFWKHALDFLDFSGSPTRAHTLQSAR